MLLRRMVPGMLICWSLLAQADWQKVTDLPALETAGLSAEQKTVLLKILREESCTCSCGMKIAECRLKDAACGDSRTLAASAAQGLKAGKTPEQVRAALRNSEVAKKETGDEVSVMVV